jgi:hypothetical protein
MRKRFVFLLLPVVATILAINSMGLSQSNKFLQIKDKALEQVHSTNRDRLIERLELYIGNIIKGNYSNVYDLMPDGCKYGLRKDEWLKEARYEAPGKLQKFILKNAYKGDYDSPEILPGEKWIIRGCGVYKIGSDTMSYDASYSALLMNGEWYICNSGVAVEGKENDYVRCSD